MTWEAKPVITNGKAQSHSELTICRADVEHVTAIVRFTLLLALEIYEEILDPATQREAVLAQLKDKTLGWFVVAILNGRPVGQIRIFEVAYPWAGPKAKSWFLDDVYVLPAFRGKGVLRAMHEYVLALAQATPDVAWLRLYVKIDNPAQAAYRRLGFETDSVFMDRPVLLA